MKTRIKVASLIMSLVLAVTMLVGCGAKEVDNTLSIGNWPNAEANPKGYELYETKKADFEAANPGVTIQPDEWRYDVQTFLAKAEGETLPDIYYTHFTEINKIIEGGYAKDIKPALVENGYYDKMPENLLKLVEQDGKVYFIPVECYTVGMALNLDLFEQAGLMEEDGTPKAPKDLNELITIATTITEKTGKPGFIYPTTNNQGGWYFTMLAWNYGVEFVTKEDGQWKATFNNEDCVAALQYLKDLKWKYNVMPANTLVDMNEVNKQIGSGTAGMGFMAPNQINAMVQNYGANKDAIGFTYLPAGPKGNVTLTGGTVLAFANTASDDDVINGFKWMEIENYTPNLSEEYKINFEKNRALALERGQLVGVIDSPIWNDKSDIFSYKSQRTMEDCNVNYNHIKLFNENRLDVHPEVEVGAQELYALLDACIQEVLTNPDADCATLIAQAASDFQHNCLDYEN